MPDVTAVLFDLDDTLVDHSSAMRQAAGILARETGVGIPEDQFYAQWKSTHAAMYPLYLRGEISHTEMCRRRIWTGIGTEAIWLDRSTDGARGAHGARMSSLRELPDFLAKMAER